MSSFDLVRFRAYADLKAETHRTYLGFLWWILEPLLFLAVFYVVLGALRGQGGSDFVAFLLVGLVLWQWFKSAVSHSSNAVLANLYLLRQVRVQPWVFPATVVLADTAKFGVVFILLLLMLPLTGHAPQLAWALVVPVLATALLLVLGTGMVAAAIVPFVPDLRFVIEAGLQALLFLSGVFFSLDSIPNEYRRYFALNPVATIIHELRTVLLDGATPDWSSLAWVSVASVGAFGAGLLSLHFGRRHYPKLAA